MSRLGNVAFILKIRVTLLRDIGAALSPFNAHQFLLGLERCRCASASIPPTRWRSRSSSKATRL